jgi:hypothetical protein
MKNLSKSLLAVCMFAAVAPAFADDKQSTSPEFNSHVDVYYTTHEFGSGTKLALDWSLSDYVRVFGTVENLTASGTDKLEDLLDQNPEQDVYKPRDLYLSSTKKVTRSFTSLEGGIGLKKEINELFDFKFEIFVNASYVQLSPNDVKFKLKKLTIGDDGLPQEDVSSGNGNEDGDDNNSIDASISFEALQGVKGAVGITSYLTESAELSISAYQYSFTGDNADTLDPEVGVAVSFMYYPIKRFGLGLHFESKDITGDSAFGLGANYRW